jgi:hypothetical protein
VTDASPGLARAGELGSPHFRYLCVVPMKPASMIRIALILAPSVALLALLRWRERRSRPRGLNPRRFDALLALRGSGCDLWADEHADKFVHRLREGWD